jgi:hypothetical protein
MTKATIATVNEWVKLIVASSLVFVLICIGILVLHVNKTLTKFDAALAAVDNTRKSVDDLLVQATTLIIDADDAATKESKVLDNVNSTVTKTLTDVDNSVLAITKSQTDITLHTVQSVDAATDAIKGLQKVTDSTSGLLASATGTVDDLRKQVDNPAIPQTFTNVAALTKQSVELAKQSTDTMQHLSGTTGEVQQAVHSYLHPTWPQRIWNILTNTGIEVAKFFW